jgi:hypothetical protein
MMPADSNLCTTCYYYKFIPRETFWKRDKDYLFPYNIGRRMMANTFDRRLLSDPKVNWRKHLKSQSPGVGQSPPIGG